MTQISGIIRRFKKGRGDGISGCVSFMTRRLRFSIEKSFSASGNECNYPVQHRTLEKNAGEKARENIQGKNRNACVSETCYRKFLSL